MPTQFKNVDSTLKIVIMNVLFYLLDKFFILVCDIINPKISQNISLNALIRVDTVVFIQRSTEGMKSFFSKLMKFVHRGEDISITLFLVPCLFIVLFEEFPPYGRENIREIVLISLILYS